MDTITTSREFPLFLKELWGLDPTTYIDETDSSDLAFQGGRKWTLRMKDHDIMIFGLSYHDQGETRHELHFYAGPGKEARCHGSTSSSRYVAGGNGTYLPGKPGIHWDVDEVVACDMFLPIAFQEERDYRSEQARRRAERPERPERWER